MCVFVWVMAHIQSSQYYVIYYYYCVIGSSLQKSVVRVAIYGTSRAGMLYGGLVDVVDPVDVVNVVDPACR